MKSALEERHNKLRRLLRDDELILLTPGENFRYLTGSTPKRLERLVAYVIGSESESFLLCPAFEKANLEAAYHEGEVIAWVETEDAFDLVASLLQTRRRYRKLGIDPTMWYWMFERLRARLPGWDFFDCGGFFERLRMRKDRNEAALIKQAALAAERALEGALNTLREGMTELDLAAEIAYRMRTEPSEVLIQFGTNSAIPHHESDRTRLGNGDVVLVDFGCRVEGYRSDITRTFVFGSAPEEFLEVREVVFAAHQKAIEKARAGIACGTLDLEARRVIASRGFGEYFTHRLGHGLGLDVHEPPYLVEGNGAPLDDGAVVTIEPGIYLPGRFGIRMEDDIWIKGEGCEVLSSGRQERVEV